MPSIFDTIDSQEQAPKSKSIFDELPDLDTTIAQTEISLELDKYDQEQHAQGRNIIDSLVGESETAKSGGLLMGVGEVLLKGAASTIGTLAGAAKGVGAGIVNTALGESFAEGFSREVATTQEQYNYTPQSDFGKKIVGTLEEYISQPVENVSNFLGDTGYETYDSPVMGAFGKSLIPAVATALGVPGVKYKGKAPIGKVQVTPSPEVRTLEIAVPPSKLTILDTIDQVQQTLYTKDVLKKMDQVSPDMASVVDRVKLETETALTPQYFGYDATRDALSDLKSRMLTEESNTLLKTELDATAIQLENQQKLQVASYLSKYEEVYGPINHNQLLKEKEELFPTQTIKKEALDKAFFIKEVAVDADGRKTSAYEKLYPDLTGWEAEGAGRLQAGKFMAERHPLVKEAISALTSMSERSQSLYNQIMYRPKIEASAGKLGIKTKAESTDKGALHIESLPSTSQKKVVEALLLMDKFGIDPAPSNFKIWGLNPDEMKAALNLREGAELARKYYNDTGLLYNKDHKVINYRYGYVPHIFTGDYRVFVKDATGDTVHVEGVGSEREAKAFAATLSKTKFKTSIERKERGNNPWGPFMEAVRIAEQIKPNADLQAIMRQLHKKALSTGSTERFTQERIGVSGFKGEKGDVKEFLSGYKSYMNSLIKATEMTKANSVLKPILTDAKYSASYPNALNYISLYKDNLFNTPGSFSQSVRRVVDQYYDYNKLTNDLGLVNRTFSSLVLFFFNTGYLAQNVLAPFMSVPPRLFAAKNGKSNIKGIGKTMAQTMKSFMFPNKTDLAVVELGVKAGVIKRKFVDELNDDPGAKLFLERTEQKINKYSGADLAGAADSWSRLMSLQMFYKHLAEPTKDGDVDMEAFRKASWLTNKHMVEYETKERPILFNERGTGAPGKLLGLFSAYPSNYLSHQLEYIRYARKDKEYKPLAASLAIQALVGGATGVVLWQEVDYILQTLGYPTASDKLMQIDPSGTLAYGPLSAATQTDIGNKLRSPVILDKKLLSAPSLEWVGELTGATLNYMSKLSIGAATPDDERDMWKSVMPRSFGGIIESAYATGQQGDIVRIQEGVRVRREMWDWVSRTLSVKSLKERKLLDSMWALQRMAQNSKLNKDSLLDSGAYISASGAELPDWWIHAVIKEGLSPNQLAPLLQKRIMDTELTVQERLQKMAKSKVGRQKLQQLEERGTSVYE